MTTINEETNCLLNNTYACLEQGLYYDEDNLIKDAIETYEKGIELFDKATQIENLQKSEFYNKLTPIIKLAKERVSYLKSNSNVKKSKSNSKKKDLTLKDLRESLEQAKLNDADLIYWLGDGVQLVIINKDQTFAPSPPTAMAIFKLDNKEINKKQQQGTSATKPSAIIQVGPWAYPLCKNETAILKNKLGVYVVPNPTHNDPEMCVGIILPRDIDPKLEEEFIYVLKNYACLKSSEIVENMTIEQKEKTSEKISNYLIKSGDIFADMITRAASKTENYMTARGEKYRSSLSKNPFDQPVNINPAIRHSAFVLHKGSKAVAKITTYLLNKIGEVGESIGRKITSNVSSTSTSGRLVHDTINVIGGGITGVSTIWISLENASKSLFRNFAQETVQTIQLKYGDEASKTAYHALYAAGHTTLASFQLYDLGPRSIAGRMARKAGLQYVKNYNSNNNLKLN